VNAMGGKPSKGTPKDGRLKKNKTAAKQLPPWLQKSKKGSK
jgi:hypothetical protein